VFVHVAENIDRVYKELTKTSANAVGGTARLDKDKGDDIPPFECGINFSTIPPRKRYREMGQLSGGEKTLAALALLLTINSYKPSPFFVFDEVCVCPTFFFLKSSEQG
jgi:structural maintenance of chromosome 1